MLPHQQVRLSGLDLPVSLRVLRAKKALDLALLRDLRVSVRNYLLTFTRVLRAQETEGERIRFFASWRGLG